MTDWLQDMQRQGRAQVGQRINPFDAQWGFSFGPNGEWNGPLQDEYRNTAQTRAGGDTFTGYRDGALMLGGRGAVGQIYRDANGRLTQESIDRLGREGFSGVVPGAGPNGQFPGWNPQGAPAATRPPPSPLTNPGGTNGAPTLPGSNARTNPFNPLVNQQFKDPRGLTLEELIRQRMSPLVR